MSRRWLWTIVMVLGLALFLGAAGLTGYNLRSTQEAGESADQVLGQVLGAMEENLTEGVGETDPNQLPDLSEISPVQAAELNLPPTALTETEIDGRTYVGAITMPTLGIELPVQSSFSYDNLRISPVRFTGDVDTGDLVICAHNYRTHFGPLRRIQEGDPVQVADMNGRVYSYEVSVVEILEPTAIQDVTSGQWPLTLFTCTLGGQTRVVVRCDMVAGNMVMNF